MFSSRFFWKLYLTFASLVVVTVVATGFLVHQQLRTSLIADVEARLLNMATSLEPYAASVFADNAENTDASPGGWQLDTAIQAQVQRMGARTNTRITLVTPDGRVVADSDGNPLVMDNHGSRPEIVAARNQPYGVSRRFSDSLEISLLYVAVAVHEAGRDVGTVRTSIPLGSVDARLAALRNTLALGAGLGVLVALGVGLVVARRITAPVREMTRVAEELRAGRYDQRTDVRDADELGQLGTTLNGLADELTDRIATLDEQRAQLDAMISGLQEGVFAVNERGHLIFFNSAADRFLDLATATLEAPLWNSVDAPELAALCADASATGDPADRELHMEREGVTHIVDAHATSFEAGTESGVVVVLHDISDLRRLEQLRSEFVANVSHELKTPLTAIRGYVETLAAGAIHDDEHNLRFLRKIDKQVDRLTAMVSDVLTLARIEAGAAARMPQAGEVAIESSAVDWRHVVRSVISDYKEAGKLQRHECLVVLPDTAVLIAGDVESMTQVLDNLLENAIKYTPAGGAITVRAGTAAGVATLEVEDTGIGISTADRSRIFERFFRTDRARSRDTGGTGLGLAIVKHLVHGMGGEVNVESEQGRGSRFIVRVPAASD